MAALIPTGPKLFRSDPDLPPAVNGVADVLQDGVEALLRVVDTKVNWIMPNTWVWIPGEYGWSESTEEGKSPAICTEYTLVLRDDNSCEYRWTRVEQTKKKTEHSMIMRGVWKQPAKLKVAAPGDGGKGVAEAADGNAGEEGEEAPPGSRPATAASILTEEPEPNTKIIDALVIVPKEISFERNTTGSTGKTVTISTKAGPLGAKPKPKPKPGDAKPERQFLRVARKDEWQAISDAIEAGEKDAELCVGPFELVFEITPDGDLARSDSQTAEEVFPSGPTSIALAGITAKAVARLGEPASIITDGWMPKGDGSTPLANKRSAPFSPLDWLALYLKTHSPSFEAHVQRQKDELQWLQTTAATARKAEIDAELAVIAAALAAKQKEAHDWLLAKAKVAIEIMRKEEEEDEMDDDE